MSTTVTYKGSTIATVDNNTKTLTTQGKYLEDNITLTDVSGGGASNVVTGTFNFSSTGSKNIDLDYDGSGYPVMVAIFPTEGVDNTTGSVPSILHRYGIISSIVFKKFADIAPTYADQSSDANAFFGNWRYKNSASNATSVTSVGVNAYSTYNMTAAGSSYELTMRMLNAKKMSVYISSNKYGYLSGVDYTYVVVYSS